MHNVKCVLLFFQAAVSPSLCSLPRLQVGPWINNQARRVSGTRWRGSLGWDPHDHQANRVITDRLSLSLRLTLSRCAEENTCACSYALKLTTLWISMSSCSASCHDLVVFQELHPDCGLSNRVRMMNHVCDLAKTKKFEEVSLHWV